MARRKTNRVRDAKIFRKTANRTRASNVCPNAQRGGLLR